MKSNGLLYVAVILTALLTTAGCRNGRVKAKSGAEGGAGRSAVEGGFGSAVGDGAPGSVEISLADAAGVTATYRLNAHPARVIMDPALFAKVADPDGAGADVSAKASGPAWTALQTVVSACLTPQEQFGGRCSADVGALAALGYIMDNSKVSYRHYAIAWANGAEKEINGHFAACFDWSSYCGVGNDHHYAHELLVTFARLYSLIRNELTEQERAKFADKMLADDEVGCVNQLTYLGSATVDGMSVTTANTGSLSLGANVWLATGTTGAWYAVRSVDSPTALTLESAATSGPAELYYAPAWTPGMCGLVWYLAHHTYTPPSVTATGSTALAAAMDTAQTNMPVVSADALATYVPFYAQIGPEWVRVTARNSNEFTIQRGMLGTAAASHASGDEVTYRKHPKQGGVDGNEATHNHVVGKSSQYLQLFYALAGDDPRSTRLLTATQRFWVTDVLAANRHWATEIFNQGGSYYWAAMHTVPNFRAAIAQKVSTTDPIDVAAGRWLKGIIMNPIFLGLPDSPKAVMRWGQALSDNSLASWNQAYVLMAQYLFPDAPETAYATYWYRSVVNYWTANELASYGGRSNILDALLYASDATIGTDYRTVVQPQIIARTTDLLDPNDQLGGVVSKSGWGATSTMLGIFAYDKALDHTIWGNPSSYNIYRAGLLLAEDGDSSTPDVGDYTAKNVLQFNGAVTGDAKDNDIDLARADTEGRFLFARVNVQGWYNAASSLTRALRYFVHMKGTGTQDYVMVYDDVATGTATSIRQALTYSNGDTKLAGTIVTSTGAGNRITSQVLLPNAGPSLVASSGDAARERLMMDCGSTSACEFLIVHRPSVDTSDLMPAAKLLEAGDGFRAVQVAGPDAKVVLLPRAGILHDGASFVSDHVGSAQYLVAGLSTGTYAVTLGGTAVKGSPFSVLSKDSTLYFESTSGNVSIAKQ
jgi:hypothetical protein